MKGSILQETQLLTLLVLVLSLCVCSQTFKIPVNLRRSIITREDIKPQLHDGESTSLSETMYMSSGTGKILQFPGEINENEDVDYKVQLSFRNQDESSATQTFNDGNGGLERFYKYSLKSQPREGEAIIFPKDALESSNTQATKEAIMKHTDDVIETDSRSDGIRFDKTVPQISYEDFEKSSNNTANIMQSLETLAHIVRQLLFRTTDIPQHIMSTEPTLQLYDTSSEPEIDVQEQALYSGPKLQTQSTSNECPHGMKITRNGSCQKPSRRLISN